MRISRSRSLSFDSTYVLSRDPASDSFAVCGEWDSRCGPDGTDVALDDPAVLSGGPE